MSNDSPPSHALPLPRYARISVADDASGLGRAIAAALVARGHNVRLLGLTTDASAATTDVLFLTVRPDEVDVEPSRLDGVVVVSCATRVVGDDDGFVVAPDPAGSVTQHVASLLPRARVVGALHLVTAAHLTLASVGALTSDVPVVGDDREATDLVEALVDEMPGFSATYGGRLSGAAAIEGMAAVLREVETTRGHPVGIKIDTNGHVVFE